MKLILLCTAMISLAMLTFAQPKLPKRPGFGAERVSINEVILMPKGER